MYENLIIDSFVTLEPNEFDNNWKNKIAEKIKQKYLGCTNKYGYIVEVLQIENNIDTVFDDNSVAIKCNTKIRIKRINPIIGKQLECTINMIFGHGIFAQIDDKIKILVPHNTLVQKGYNFNKMTNEYTKGTGTTTESIVKLQKIKIEITDVKYSKNMYNCIGKLIDTKIE